MFIPHTIQCPPELPDCAELMWGRFSVLGSCLQHLQLRAGWALFQFNFSIRHFSANSGFFGFISCYCPFAVFAVSLASLKGSSSTGWVSRVRESSSQAVLLLHPRRLGANLAVLTADTPADSNRDSSAPSPHRNTGSEPCV